jgi:GNAT superfamily N-acetyltransferase
MLTSVTTYYLELTSPHELKAKRCGRDDLTFARVDPPMPELNRFFYTAVGGAWYWTDRLPWTYGQWLEWLGRPGVQTWLLSAAGVPTGYVELDGEPGGAVEVAYFGLLPPFIGQGLGAHLLTLAVERAWAVPAPPVWVHTCTLDHPHALAHYQARGFRLYREDTSEQDLLEQPPGPWPGSSAPPPADPSRDSP